MVCVMDFKGLVIEVCFSYVSKPALWGMKIWNSDFLGSIAYNNKCVASFNQAGFHIEKENVYI